jgi:hypothetical protein
VSFSGAQVIEVVMDSEGAQMPAWAFSVDGQAALALSSEAFLGRPISTLEKHRVAVLRRVRDEPQPIFCHES